MQTGEIIGRYLIKEKIGSGGMGEVYRAADEQLDRDVALKVLLSEFCCDVERVKRFKFEAKAVSALNHPGIITIHEIVEEDGRLFIATELVDGVTVRDKIEGGELNLYEAVRIAEQAAEALAVAHDANIVHRDIKPENIMIRHDGFAKILDFGLAKPIAHAAAGTEDATIQMVKTQPGLVMGSVRYMSPEQARGREADGTTDVWSLGIVLYEMITGINPFEGETISDSIAALIHKEPELPENVPDELIWALRKSLNKSTSERYQNIKDFALDLKSVRMKLEQASSGEMKEHLVDTGGLAYQNTAENKTLIQRTLSAENRTTDRTGLVNRTRVNTASEKLGFGTLPAVVITAVAALSLAAWYFSPSLFGNGNEPFQSLQVSRMTDNGKARSATVSPDGKFAAFVDTEGEDPRMFIQQIATGTSVEIVPATKKEFLQPSFSPDGNFIFYVTVENGVGTLFRVSTLGGTSKQIAVDVDSRPAVAADGSRIAFIRHNPKEGGDTILTVNSEGGAPEPFIQTKQIGFNKFNDVVWTDQDRYLLMSGFKVNANPNARTSIVSVSVENEEVVDTAVTELLNGESWAYATGFNWLSDDSGLLFIGKKEIDDALQIWHLRSAGKLIESITTDTSDYESLSVSADGGIIIATKADRISGLIEYTRNSNESRQLKDGSKNFLGHLGISQMPDGRILYSKLNGKEANIFAIDDGGGEEQLTSDSGFNIFPASTSDGKFIVFSSSRNDNYGIWRMRPDGSQPVALTQVKDGRDMMPQIAKDGNAVIFSRQLNDGSSSRLMSVPIEGGETMEMFPGSSYSEMMPQISPDGKRLAFISSEYDIDAAELMYELKIADISKAGAAKVVESLEIDSAHLFRWSPSGDSIIYKSKSTGLLEVSLISGKKTPLTFPGSGEIMNFLWSRDGSRIFTVRGMINSDLVLIKNLTKA